MDFLIPVNNLFSIQYSVVSSQLFCLQNYNKFLEYARKICINAKKSVPLQAEKNLIMLHVLASSLHQEPLQLPQLDEEWVNNNQVVAVMTGGSEQLFLQKVQEGVISLDEPIYLIAGQQSNSLAACCEILSWINLNNGHGEIRSYRNAE